jgi:hypothetical protein|tara:strand:- start:907 stop:1335 length:429 start_codon:yes stop_codon:yes gene_type:complete
MIEKYDGIEETLNVETEIVPTEKTPKPKKRTERVIDIEKDIKKDYDYTRGQLYDVIEKGQEALSGILDVANNTDHPRAYEVAGQLVKSVSDAAEKLVALQQKMQDLEEGPKSKQKVTNNNALFVGSTAELSKLIKQGLLDNK